MYCKYCGQRIDSDSRFCSACGKELIDSSNGPASLSQQGSKSPEQGAVPIVVASDSVADRVDYSMIFLGIIVLAVGFAIVPAFDWEKYSEEEIVSWKIMLACVKFLAGGIIGLVAVETRNRSFFGWFIFGLFLPGVALIALGLSSSKSKEPDSSTEAVMTARPFTPEIKNGDNKSSVFYIKEGTEHGPIDSTGLAIGVEKAEIQPSWYVRRVGSKIDWNLRVNHVVREAGLNRFYILQNYEEEGPLSFSELSSRVSHSGTNPNCKLRVDGGTYSAWKVRDLVFSPS